MNLNWSEFQIINSSAILDICIEHIDELYKKSKTKSLSETVSKELFVGSSNFSFLVVYHLSILKDVPEKAVMVGIPAKNVGLADSEFKPYGITPDSDTKSE